MLPSCLQPGQLFTIIASTKIIFFCQFETTTVVENKNKNKNKKENKNKENKNKNKNKRKDIKKKSKIIFF